VQANPPGKDLSVSDCEQIIIALLIEGYITIDAKFTRYEYVNYAVSCKMFAFLADNEMGIFRFCFFFISTAATFYSVL